MYILQEMSMDFTDKYTTCFCVDIYKNGVKDSILSFVGITTHNSMYTALVFFVLHVT